jgi:hypothetical protein
MTDSVSSSQQTFERHRMVGKLSDGGTGVVYILFSPRGTRQSEVNWIGCEILQETLSKL